MMVVNNFQAQVAQEARRQLDARAEGAMRAVPEALVEALRSELKQLVEGDLPKTIGQLIKVATRAKELFVAIRSEEGLAPGGRVLGDMGSYEPIGAGVYSSYSPNTNPEQFGARAIRELVSLIPEILGAQKGKDSPSELVTAIAFAKAQGMDDVVTHLRAKLFEATGTAEAKQDAPLAIAPPAAAPEVIDAVSEKSNGTNGVTHVCSEHDVREGGA